jgi:hypothetical protein
LGWIKSPQRSRYRRIESYKMLGGRIDADQIVIIMTATA